MGIGMHPISPNFQKMELLETSDVLLTIDYTNFNKAMIYLEAKSCNLYLSWNPKLP